MRTPQNYILGKCLHATSESEVYAALRESDRLEVVLKSYARDALARGVSRSQREFAALRAAAGRGVPRALELIADPGSTILVLERVPGTTLRAWVHSRLPDPRSFLVASAALAEALVRVHEGRLVHRDIHPGNVLVDAQSSRACLVDFGLAQALGDSARESESGGEAAVHELRYVAPEQTGRMDRGVDSRSDLYSLGATLYFALTGHAPFELSDPLALMHAHIARLPPSPLEHRPELPHTLARIVLKLLQKQPEERYQTAQALLADLLECQAQLSHAGRIHDGLSLGTADLPGRPLFSQRVYGRQAELATLTAAFARARDGAAELVLLSGLPGSGKSALANELRRPVAESGAYLASGKFDLYRRDVPYSGIRAALGSLVDQLLTESEARLARWREQLLAELGPLASVMVELVPDLGIVLGGVADVPALGPRETQVRLALAVLRFLRACARPEHPLVLFLDDLQWSDPGSRYLLLELVGAGELGALLLIAAYRDSELGTGLGELRDRLESGRCPVTHVALGPLPAEAAVQMLAEAMRRPLDATRYLGEVVALKTERNPLFIQQFVLHMHALGWIRPTRSSGWTWDDAAIASADIPEGVVALMIAKLERLEPAACELIQFASCIGDEFDAPLLAELLARSKAELADPLFRLSEEGLIAPSRFGFRFVHDRIREAAQSLLSADARTQLHYRTARLLLERTPPEQREERAFEIADHLKHAPVPASEPERREALAIHRLAGRRALAAGSAAGAVPYYRSARALFREHDWASDRELAFGLFDESAEAAYQMRDFERALELLDALDARASSRWERARIESKRIRVFLFARPEQVVDRTLAALREWGVRWPRRPSWLRVRLAMLHTDWLLRRPLAENLFPATTPQDPSWLAPILLISAGGSALQRGGIRLVFLASAYALRQYIRHGTPPQRGPGLALAAYAGYRLSLLGHLRRSALYARATAFWMHRRPSPFTDPRGAFDLHAFVRSWLEPKSAVVEPLWAAAEACREVGDVEFFRYAAGQHVALLALSGEPLPAFLERLVKLIEQGRSEDLGFLECYRRAFSLLRGGAPPGDWSAELAAANHSVVDQLQFGIQLSLPWIVVLCVLGEYARAFELCEAVTPTLGTSASPGAYRADFLMLRAVSRAGVAEAARGAARRAHERALRRAARKLHRWAQLSPDVEHMAQLVDAEHAGLRGQSALALRTYQRASQRAAERGYLHHAALCQERRALLLQQLRRATEADSSLQQAIRFYREWGADAKVAQLEARAARSAGANPR